MFSTPLPHFNVVNVVTWSKQSRVNCKPQETTLSGGRGGKYYLPACKPRHSRKMYDICLFQLLLSMIVDSILFTSWTGNFLNVVLFCFSNLECIDVYYFTLFVNITRGRKEEKKYKHQNIFKKKKNERERGRGICMSLHLHQ